LRKKEMKKCPFCAEEIQDDAIKCKHCKEFLNDEQKAESEDSKKEENYFYGKCTDCEAALKKDSDFCPKCGIMQIYENKQGTNDPRIKVTRDKKKSIDCYGLLLFSILLFIGLLWSFIGINSGVNESETKSTKTSEPEYSGVWLNDFSVGISRALVKNNIRGCGQYKYMPSSKATGKFKVKCTSDGTNWKEYLVYVGSGKVIGPQ
jgi:RNA polymerase subunit RPABC4/transcription elongation factor Spt4